MADLRPIRAGLLQLSKQLQKLCDQHNAKALKFNKRRSARDGGNLPLSAWMLGTKKTERSKIIAVCENRAQYPYKTLSASVYAVADRATKGKQLTAIQRAMILIYVSGRYRGRVSDNSTSYWAQEFAIDKDVPENVRRDTNDWLEGCMYAAPLSLLLSEQLTDLLISAHLYFALIKGNTYGSNPTCHVRRRPPDHHPNHC